MNPVSASQAPSRSARSFEDVLTLATEEMRLVEERLAERMDSPIGAIPQVGAHLLEAGGKRLRPLLAVLAARATGAPVEHAVAVGCAAELIHTATLYHDDVVDDGRVRRGGAAPRVGFGNGLGGVGGGFFPARAPGAGAPPGAPALGRSLAAR